jgi:hypothetical protein
VAVKQALHAQDYGLRLTTTTRSLHETTITGMRWKFNFDTGTLDPDTTTTPFYLVFSS